MIEHLGSVTAPTARSPHATIFPNTSFLPTTNTLRVWHPRGPDAMEVYAWIIVDKSMPPEVKEAQRLQTHSHVLTVRACSSRTTVRLGEIQKVLKGTVQKRYAFNYQMGLGHSRATTIAIRAASVT